MNMNLAKSTILFAAIMLGACCHCVEPPHPSLRPLSDSERRITNAGNDFAFSLLRKVTSPAPQNICVSPLSVGMALGMSLNGARGETRQGILTAIDYGNLDSAAVNAGYQGLMELLPLTDLSVRMDLANSAWSSNSYTLSPSFISIINSSYLGKAQSLDFSDGTAKDVINHWVESQTDNKIQNLLSDIQPNEILLLINALYFKGGWTEKFYASNTHPADFHSEDGSTRQVSTMHSDKLHLTAYRNVNVLLANLPYGNGQFSMSIIVPQGSKKIQDIMTSISADSLSVWLAKSDSISPVFEMPKFKMDWKGNLNQPLAELGMSTAFSDSADFPYLFEEQLPLAITRVIHQTFIQVDEEGTVAAAATGIGVGITAVPIPEVIKVDRPFLFLIREKYTGVILFIGQIHAPAF